MDTDALDSLAQTLGDAEQTVALTGAGVSTASGIPSFRGEDGLWDRWDPNAFHRRRLEADPAGFWRDRVALREELTGDIDPEPNPAHTALAELERAGQIEAVLTQNIDGLHEAAGSETVVRLHGTRRRVRCDDCGGTRPADPVFERAGTVQDADDEGDTALPPRCDCGGVYRPDVVLFGESLSDDVLGRAQRLARESDVVLAVGSSLTVRPASLLPKITVDAGGTLAVVNFDQTPLDGRAEFVFRDDVTELLPALAGRL